MALCNLCVKIRTFSGGINLSTKQDLTQIIDNLREQAESNELEFKESLNKLPKDFWETYSAFDKV